MPDTTTDKNEPAEKVEDQASPDDTEQGETTPDTEQAGSEQEQPEGTEEQSEDEDTDESGLSREDALKALKKVREEAAAHRTKLRALEKRYEGAKTPEEIEQIRSELKAETAKAEHALVVENVALRHKLDDGLSSILAAASEGKTREELEAHAATLAKYLPADSDDEPDLSGGLRPGTGDDSFDAREQVNKHRRRR